MVFSVDQFMQVKCKLQLTSESDSAESIHSANSERIRLCSSAEIDKNASIIVMVCSNDSGNNHILVYYAEKRQHASLKFIKPRIIVKQIYYNSYNEDIQALCLGDSGNKLILISASASIYIIPIKNILLNLNAQQLRSSQGKSMYFYDALILNCCKTIEDPVAIVCWRKVTLIAADQCGKICFINIEEKKEIFNSSLKGEQIQAMYIVQDYLIVLCNSLNQYRLSLDLLIGTNLNSTLEFHKIPCMFYSASANLVSVIDGLSRGSFHDTKLLRFFSSKQFFHRPQKPQLICKMPHLRPDETITHLVLTDRFIALATNNDRCLINSRNCCDLKFLQSSATSTIEINSLVKEIKFNHEEKILHLINSPVSNDLDNIIDSFLLITTKSIYCIEARYSCREMYINLIDSHLGISLQQNAASLSLLKSVSINPDTIVTNSALINTFLCYRDELYERICYDSRAFSLLFKLDLNSIYEAYGDRSLQRCQFELANRFFQMAKFGHAKILNKYLRVGAYKQTIDYITNILSDENEILEEKERIDLSRAAFDCLLAKTIVERGKTLLYNVRIQSIKFKKLLDYHQQQLVQANKSVNCSPNASSHKSLSSSSLRNKNSNNNHNNNMHDDYRLLSNTLSGSFDLFRLCGHSPRGQDAKLSATTIIADQHDDNDDNLDEEATLTSNSNSSTSQQKWKRSNIAQQQQQSTSSSTATSGSNFLVKNSFNSLRLSRCCIGNLNSTSHRPMECEKALVDFVKNLMPASLYNYAMLQLLDFDLIELVEIIASRSQLRIYSLLRILARERDEDRLIFRDGRNELLMERLARLNQKSLVKIDNSKREFLEFLTSLDVTRVLVKDISLTSEFYGYQHTLIQFRKFSFATLKHLETYKKFIMLTNGNNLANFANETTIKSQNEKVIEMNALIDDNALDGNDDYFKRLTINNEIKTTTTTRLPLTETQRQHIIAIFTEFLNACLNESTEDSCRLWYNFVNFYLNYVGPLENLECDIMELVSAKGDCRMAITLYKAIYRDENELKDPKAKKSSIHKSNNRATTSSTSRISDNEMLTMGDNGEGEYNNMAVTDSINSPQSILARTTNVANTSALINPLESMSKLYNLSDLFENDFLINLLAKTLDLIPKASDLDALSVVAMC